MKKIGIMLSAAAALMMAGCAKDMTETPEVGVAGTLYATVEGSDNTTRVGFDKSGTFYWSAGDKIGVFNMPAAGNDDYDIRGAKFDILSGAGTGSASFLGQVDGSMDGDVVIYPYNENIRLLAFQNSRPEARFSFPSKYTYTKVDTDFFSAEKGKGNSFNAYMWGVVKDNAVELKHLAGVFCVKIDKMPSESGVFEFSASEPFTGGYASLGHTGSDGEAVYKDYPEIRSDGGDASVAIEFSGAEVGKPGVFYIPVPTGKYTNVTVSVSDSDGGNKISIPCGNYTIKRAMLKAIYPTVAAGGSMTVSSADAVSSAISDTTPAVTVSGKVQSDATITIPSVSAQTPVSVSFAQIPTAALTFTDGSGAGTSASELVVAIPYNELIDLPAMIKPSVRFDMPNTTVTLAATAGKAVYGTVEATTANNTLIIDSGVTVTEVVVKKGNVRVNSGATVDWMSNETGATVTIYKEAGATIPDNLDPSSFVVVDTSLDDLKEAAAKGGEYVLQSDMAFTEPLVVKGNLKLDLNGHSITAEGETLNKVLNTSDALILVRRGATLTINDSSNGKGSIDTGEKEAIYAAVKLTDTNDGASGDVATLVVNGGVLKGYYYGISGNGTRHNTAITVNGGTIGAYSGTGIYHPQDGVLEVTGGEISGTQTGIEMRSGSLNVSGGRILSTAAEFTAEANGNGTTISGAAVAVSQHSTNLDLSVAIIGGVFDGVYALYEKDFQDDTARDKISLSVTGGTFNGSVYSDNCENFVSGGTFSDPSALKYLLASGAADVSVVLTENAEAPGFKTNAGQTVSIDMQGHKLTLNDPTVGSSGTETNSCQLLQGSTVTFRNGTLESANNKIMIQNYSNLTLYDMTVNGPNAMYVVSNNCGNVVIENTTINGNQNSGNFAFDVCGFSSYPGVSVTVRGNSVINGDVEISQSAGRTYDLQLNIEGGEFNGALSVHSSITNAAEIVNISGSPVFNGDGWEPYK